MSNLRLPISIEDLLTGRSVEWERLDYKKGWNPKAVLHTICAFANDFHNLGGGYIIIGVEEKNSRPLLPPRGISPEKIDAIQKEILNLGNSSIQPKYHPVTAPCQVDGRHILVIWVPGGETRPYKARISLGKEKREMAYYIRKQSSTVLAQGSDERELISLAATVPYDDRYNHKASLTDLSKDLIEKHLQEVGSDLAEEVGKLPIENLARGMKIAGGPKESVVPKNVGLLFFNKNPEDFFPVTQIDVVWFPDGPGGDKFEEKIFKGPLSQMTREALNFVERNYLKETVIKHPDRAEAERVWNFPYAAVEEGVVNAVYHRSYEEREPVEVRITPEEISILSFPGPDRSIRMKDLRTGHAVARRYRNRRIGEFFKELELTEGRSTGIPKILQAMQKNGSPPPEFDTDEDRTYFLIRFPVNKKIIQKPSETGQVTGEVTGEVAGEVIGLLKALTKPLKRKEIQGKMGLGSEANFRERYLDPALEEGLVEMTQPESPNSPTQKYRLTEKGRKLLGI